MLMIQRQYGQAIRIGDDIVIRVERGTGNQVKLGITAPRSLKVWRVDEPEQASDRLDNNGQSDTSAAAS